MSNSEEQFEKTVNIFIDSIDNYFTKLTQSPVETFAPFVKKPEELLLRECTGMIGIAGVKKGLVYISGDLAMYEELIKDYVGYQSPKENDMLDMAGELSNVVAGNVREVYGDSFLISVPIVFKGKPDNLRFPDNVPIYVIPFKWRSYQAYMVVGIQ
ncbi:MAG: chemotaxis protein CheX [Bacteroidota bacterium]